MRSLNVIQAASIVCAIGVALSSFLPTFIRDLHASRLTEAIDNVSAISKSAIAYSEGRDLAGSFPAPAPLTPAEVPRGVVVTDPQGTWDHPSWKALSFEVLVPHRFSYSFDVTVDPARISFSAQAHGDLNGDGLTSTFEVRGERRPGQSAELIPGMLINREVE
jgi:hypothetical protein